MKVRKLGKSGIAISPLVMGCWSAGGDYFGSVEDRDSIACIRTYLEHGINTFDTAEIYGSGRAEEVLGRALEGTDREKSVIISKVWPAHYEAKAMEEACDATLKRLGMDYLDVYFLHYPPAGGMTVGQAVENMNALKEKGKIRSIGVSLINSFGIVLITKGALGTSQISSIPYVLSLQLPSISFGMFSFIMNMVYIVLQALLLRRQFKPIQLLQIVVNVVFSASIDVFMAMLSFYAPQQLFTRVLSAVAGCIVLAFGISVEVAPDLIMVPGEGIVAAISKVSGRRFGSVKVVFDVTLILIAALLSWLFFGNIVGVGVGTLLSAVSVGQFVNLINRHVPLLQHIRALAKE